MPAGRIGRGREEGGGHWPGVQRPRRLHPGPCDWTRAGWRARKGVNNLARRNGRLGLVSQSRVVDDKRDIHPKIVRGTSCLFTGPFLGLQPEGKRYMGQMVGESLPSVQVSDGISRFRQQHLMTHKRRMQKFLGSLLPCLYRQDTPVSGPVDRRSDGRLGSAGNPHFGCQ